MASSTGAPIQNIACTPRKHFTLHLYAAIYYLICHLIRLGETGGDRLETVLEKYPFLEAYLVDILRLMPDDLDQQDGTAWWERRIGAWEQTADRPPPLLALSRAEALDFSERLALMLVGLVEEDSRFGTVFSWLQAPLACRRPCWELLNLAAGPDPAGQAAAGRSVCRRLLDLGLVAAGNPEAPRSEWALRVPAELWDVIRGDPLPDSLGWGQVYPATELADPADLILPPEFQAQVNQVPLLLQGERTKTFILRGTPGSQRLAVIGAVARALGRGIIVTPGQAVSFNGAGPAPRDRPPLGLLCTLTGMLPVLSYDLGPGETVTPPLLRGYGGPVLLLLGPEGGVAGQAAARSVTLTLPPPGYEQRRRLWQAALNGHPVEALETISRRFHLPGEYIRQAAAMAIAQARLAHRPAVQPADVRAACRTLNRQALDTLATPLEAEGRWEQLVVSAMTMAKLRETARRCAHRETLLAHLGPAFESNSNRGVRVLFTGPSGTGKTWAARILAAELEMDLYRVDLAAVINKYIGETEKNLNRVLARAEELDVILLLDEGDSLLGGRTDVKSANDRYANLETNYLLQKLETYQGVVVVATNLGQNIDRAFQRRMDVVVNFIPPEADERRAIWQLHLPEDHAVSPPYLETVAARCPMTGGQIRNAAFHAALLALDEEDVVVQERHLDAALQSEYRKAGATFPLQNGRPAASHGGMNAFLNTLAMG